MEYADLHCSFCGKSATEVKKLIAGPDVYICNECVDKCYGILSDGAGKSAKAAVKPPPSPREIKQFLDQYVIGQDHAKETLAVAVYNHYKRLNHPIIGEVEIEKSNILMFGPTGVGKTLLAQTIARFLDVPFAIADATSLTEAGYVGDDVESIITRLLQAADNDPRKAERGIVFLDEIDKKRSKSDGGSSSRDVSGEGVQQALLKLFEGADVLVPLNGARKNPNTEMVKINTRNILFIVGGAFVGLDKVVERALASDTGSIGFSLKTMLKNSQKSAELLRRVEPDHLISYGLIPELVGRLPVITALDELDEGQLMRVLTEPKNAVIKQYCALFKLDDVDLTFDADALQAIAQIARQRQTGGRALRSVIEAKLMRTQFNLPDLRKQGANRIVVHAATFNADAQPEVFYDQAGVGGNSVMNSVA
jgi:ATP-dependent Clp protease ATP-binding subunit ClpX